MPLISGNLRVYKFACVIYLCQLIFVTEQPTKIGHDGMFCLVLPASSKNAVLLQLHHADWQAC